MVKVRLPKDYRT